MSTAEATRIRVHRSALLQELRSSRKLGPTWCADLLERPPECLLGMDVHELLEECAGVGPTRADQIQQAAGVFRAWTIGEIPPTKRAALVALLRFRSPFTRRAA